MSSLRTAVKSHVRTYKERSQLSKRKHLGILEKHKDYKLRAKDYHKKQKYLKRLRIKAKEKNPDEFYFKMISQKTQEGIHFIQNEQHYTQEELKLMKTQDINYITMKKSIESKKIEKLQANLHFPDTAGPSKKNHIIFVDSVKEAKRKEKERQERESRQSAVTYDEEVEALRQQSYEELNQRKRREQMLENARQQLQMKKQLMGKGRVYKKEGEILDDGTRGKASYRWRQERKR